MRALLTLLTLLLVPLVAIGEPVPTVNVKVNPPTVNVGEPVTIEVTVLVPTWFASPPLFPGFELTNTITTLPPDSSYPVSERINGDTWSGIRRHYQVYPLLAANFEITDQQIQVKWANPGKAPHEASIQVPTIRYSSVVPAGAENLAPYLAGNSFTLTRTVSTTEQLEPGDAVTIELEATLTGLPAMFIPPLWPDTSIPGARVYPAEAVVTDEPIASRRERITVVLETPGEYTVPGRSINWWNLETGKVEVASLPAINLPVAGKVPTAVDSQRSDDKWIWLAALLIAAGLTWGMYRRTEERTAPAEEMAYQAAMAAIRSRDDAAIYRTVLDWLKDAGYPSSQAAFSDNPDLMTAFNQVRDNLHTDNTGQPDYSRLQSGIRQLRRDTAHPDQQTVLPALNP